MQKDLVNRLGKPRRTAQDEGAFSRVSPDRGGERDRKRERESDKERDRERNKEGESAINLSVLGRCCHI